MPGMKTWAVGEEVLAADFNSYMQSQVVAQFPTKAALDAGWATAPDGAMAVTVDTFAMYVRRAGAWSKVFDQGMAVVSFTSGGGNVPHTLGRTPIAAVLTVAQNAANFLAWNGLTPTVIQARAFTQAGAAYTGNLNVAYWCA